MNDQTSALVTDRVGGIARRRRTAAEALVPTTAALAAMLASEGALAQQAAEASKGTPIKSFATVKAYKQLSNGNLQVQLQTGQTVTLPAYQVAHGADGAILLTPEGVSALDQWVAIPPDMHHGHGHTLPIVLGVVALGGGAGAALAGGGSKSAPPGNPVFSTAAAISTPEGQIAVTNVFATDPAGKGVTYSITGGADAGDFKIDAKSGALIFKSAPVYDTPPTTNPNNSYTVTVNAVDGTTSASQTFTINVTNVNEPPNITSAATVQQNENNASTGLTVTATDTDKGTVLTYSISGGADAALFKIDPATGMLTWISAPNFEAPLSSTHDNNYALTVAVSDGVNTTTQAVTVQVLNVNDNAPVLDTAATSVSIPENTANTSIVIHATDADGTLNPLTYLITGGPDQGLFTINPTTGVLAFRNAPNYEKPLDAGKMNVYHVQVGVSDSAHTVTQEVTVTVTNLIDTPPTFTSPASISVAENQMLTGLTVTTTDPEPGVTVTYSISGGPDAALFTIDPNTGLLAFKTAPDYEMPQDTSKNNGYDLTVKADDGHGNTSTQTIHVAVTNVNDNSPYFTSSSSISVPQNVTATGLSVTAADPDGTLNPLTFSITGGPDAALLTVDPRTGAISFKSPPSFTNPMDFNHDNHYLITVSVSDTLHVTSQNLDVQVLAPVGPAISSPASASFAENGTAAALTIVSSDAAGNGGPITYAIEGGADANLFSIDANSGALSFKSSPNYEAPLDAGHNNDYVVNVAAIDKNGTGTQTVQIVVTNVNDNAPVLVSPTAISTPEDVTTTGLTVHATDADGTLNPLVYSIVGGPDAALFHLDQNSGVLTWNSAPSFANPLDQGHDNVYNLTVQVTDSKFVTTEDLAVTVTHVNHPPVITSPASVSVNEHITTPVLTVSATDPDAGDTPVFAIAGGPDGALFTIDTTSGALSFKSPPIFEMPQDAGFKNQYHVTVSASDGHGGTVSQAIAVNVLNVNEPPVFTGPTSVSVPSGQVNTGLAITATDNDIGTKLTFSLAGGPDGALFKVDASSGALSFLKAPDFAHPLDQGMDNIYDLTVRVSDGVNGVTEAVKVTVTPAAAVAAALSAVPVDPVAATSGAATHSTDVGRPAADTAKAGGTAAVYAITTEVGHVAAPTAADVAAKWVDAFATVADSHAGAAELALVDALHLAAAQPLHDGAHVAT